MSNPETETHFSQPELPFPEGSTGPEAQVINESIHEDRFAVSSIRDVLGAWRNHFRERRNARNQAEPAIDSRYIQPELPFPEASDGAQTEVMDATVSEEQTAVSSLKEVIGAWKTHLKNKQSRSEEFHASLKDAAQARLSGETPSPERVGARTRAERRAEIRAEKAIYKHARTKENERWANAVHGTRKGAISTSETRKARRDVIKAAKQLHKDGVIDGQELMKRITESAGIIKYEENSTQKRARKKVDSAAVKVLKKSDQPRLRRLVGSQLTSPDATPVTAAEQPVETVSAQESEPTQVRDIPVVTEASSPVEVTVHKRKDLFPAAKAKSFKFDRQGKLTSTHTGPLPTREKVERSKREKPEKRKSREGSIPKEALSLFGREELEAAYSRIELDIEEGKLRRLAELNEGKPAKEQLKVFPREELGEVVADARRAEIRRMLGDEYSDDSERALMAAFTALHRQKMQEQLDEEQSES